MFSLNAFFRRHTSCARVVSLSARVIGSLCILLSANAFAAFSSSTSLSSSLNPSTAVDNVTFTAVAHSTAYDIRQSLGFGISSSQAGFIRYDLVNATFSSVVTASQLTDVTNGANVSVTVGQGGRVGDSYVVFNLTAGPSGTPVSDILSFVTPGLNAPNPGNASVFFSQHGSAFSSSGANPPNTDLLISNGPIALQSQLTTVVPTGTMQFQLNGLTIAGCAALPLSAATAQCSLTIGTAGSPVVTANYSGDGNYAGSLGTLSPVQVVRIALNATIPPATYKTPYSFTFTPVGNTGATTYSAPDGLPNGLNLSAAGVLSGTPTVVGSGAFRIAVQDAAGATGVQSYLQVINASPQSITFSMAPSVYAGTQLTLNGVASSGLAVSYTTNTPLTCYVIGNNVLRFSYPGSCSVVANQAGNVFYGAANSVLVATVVQSAVGPHEIRVRSPQAQAQLQVGRLVGNQIQFTADVDPGPAFRLLGTVDFDGNRTTDLLYQNTTQGTFGDVRVWKDFLPANDSLVRNVKLVWDVQATGDLDGDGLGDLVWRYMQDGTPDTGVSYVWFSNGSGVSEVRKRGGAPLNWTLLGARDLNYDGAADMVYISPDNQIRVLMATAGRSCANFSAGAIPAGFTALRFADFSGNQRGDILIRNAATGEVRLLSLDATALILPPSTANPNDPNASCTSTTATVAVSSLNMPATPATWTFYASADFNGDGIADVVWRQPDGTLTLWMMNPSGSPTVYANVGSAPVGFTVQP